MKNKLAKRGKGAWTWSRDLLFIFFSPC